MVEAKKSDDSTLQWPDRRQGGRPRKPAYLKKTGRINARVQPDKLATIRRVQAQLGFERESDFLLYCLDQMIRLADGGALAVPPQMTKADPEALRLLGGACNNLNQLTRKFHQTGEPPPPELREVLQVLRTFLLTEYQKK